MPFKDLYSLESYVTQHEPAIPSIFRSQLRLAVSVKAKIDQRNVETFRLTRCMRSAEMNF